MVKQWLAIVLLSLAIGVFAQGSDPVWNDGFASGNLANYLQGPIPKSAGLVKAGPDGNYALRLAPGLKTAVILKEFPVEPGVKYRLEFAAKTDGPDVIGQNPATEKLFFAVDKAAQDLLLPGWEIRVVNAAGQLPYEGHYQSYWQYCFHADWCGYRQSFYTPADAAKVQIIFNNPGGQDTLLVAAVRLVKSTEPNLLTGAETFNTPYDYSGWSEVSKAGIITVNGKLMLHINPGGYALTDPLPVRPGEYRVTGKKPNATAFFYDADMHRIGTNRWASAKFTVPQGCAYVQLYFGPGDIEGIAVTQAPEVKK